jgi:hypothetical protein
MKGVEKMAAEETASGLSGWVIAIISTLAGVVVAFFLNILREKQQEKRKRIQAALVNHFNQEMTVGLHHIGQCSGLKIMPERKNELVFDSEDVQFVPINKSLTLKDEEKEAFKIHFPQIAGTWEELHKRALELWEENKNNALKDKEVEEVSSALKELSKTAKGTLKHINKNNRIGTKEFHYDKKCPICKKF